MKFLTHKIKIKKKQKLLQGKSIRLVRCTKVCTRRLDDLDSNRIGTWKETRTRRRSRSEMLLFLVFFMLFFFLLLFFSVFVRIGFGFVLF